MYGCVCDSDRRLCCRQSAAKHLEQKQWQIAAQLSNCPKQVISDLCRRAQRSIVAGAEAARVSMQLALICHRLTAYRLPIESRLAREHHQIKLLKLHWQDAATSISNNSCDLLQCSTAYRAFRDLFELTRHDR